jgi:hypothetical protein
MKSMAVLNLSEPLSEVWLALASIYEQYGVIDAAIEAYRKVERPEGRIYPTRPGYLRKSDSKRWALADWFAGMAAPAIGSQSLVLLPGDRAGNPRGGVAIGVHVVSANACGEASDFEHSFSLLDAIPQLRLLTY